MLVLLASRVFGIFGDETLIMHTALFNHSSNIYLARHCGKHKIPVETQYSYRVIGPWEVKQHAVFVKSVNRVISARGNRAVFLRRWDPT